MANLAKTLAATLQEPSWEVTSSKMKLNGKIQAELANHNLYMYTNASITIYIHVETSYVKSTSSERSKHLDLHKTAVRKPRKVFYHPLHPTVTVDDAVSHRY